MTNASASLAVAASMPAAAEGASASLAAYRSGRFRRRCDALFGVRCALLAGLSAIALLPGAAASLGLAGGGAWMLIAGLALGAAASRILLDTSLARPAHFVSLCLEAAVLAHLLLASGGLFSPLLGTQLLLLVACLLLFDGPLALVPAFLILPIAAGLHHPGKLEAADLFLLAWYGALDGLVIAVLRWLGRRDEEAHIALASLEEARRASAILAERQRLSREIHDGVGAALSTLLLQAELAGTRIDGPGREAVGGLRATAEEAIDELRRSVRMLRGDFESCLAAEELCERFAERTGLAIDCSVEGAGRRLGPEAELTLFRVLQESLQNAARHAKANRIAVRLDLSAAGARLEVEDDGIGFDPGAATPGHYGLRGMRERARGCGGSLLIRASPGAGTAIELQLPPQVVDSPGLQSQRREG